MIHAILSRNAYTTEEGTEGVRRDVLDGLETRLKLTIRAAEAFQAASGSNANLKVTWNPDGAGRSAPTVKVGATPPAAGQLSVHKLRKMHRQAQDNTVMQKRLNAEIIRMRQWLHRQGAKLTPNGTIVWPKSTRVVEYDRDLQRRGLSRLQLREKRLFLNGTPFDTTNMATAFLGPGYAIYCMSAEGHIHVDSHSVGHRHHSSMFAGEDVACAGELQVERGVLRYLSNKSGHYRPDVFQLLQVLRELAAAAIPLDFRVDQLNEDRSTTEHESVSKFLRANAFDNDSIEAILLARAAELRRAQQPRCDAAPDNDEDFYESEPKVQSTTNPYLWY